MDGQYICVMEIDNRNPVYEGTSCGAAALALVSGTTFGKGRTKEQAADAAVEACRQASVGEVRYANS